MTRFDSNKVRELRSSRGLTIAEFAAQIGATRQAVCLWESGEFKPSAATIEKICSTFGVEPNYLFNIIVTTTDEK